jgi:hypothetical protein
MSKPLFPSDTPEIAAARAALQRVLGQQRRGQPEPAAVAQPRVLTHVSAPRVVEPSVPWPALPRVVESEPARPAPVVQQEATAAPARGELLSATDGLCLHLGRITSTGAELEVWYCDALAARARTWPPFNDLGAVEIDPNGMFRSFADDAPRGPIDPSEYAMAPYAHLDSEPDADERIGYVRQHLMSLLTPEARRRLAALAGGAGCAAT